MRSRPLPNLKPHHPPARQRRALSHVGGRIEVFAPDAELAAILKASLEVDPDEQKILDHVHGFHSYPARMHPDTARTLIQRLSRPGDSVLDPFCGSGTVPVVARELGRRGFGSDLNPLGVALSRLKISDHGPGFPNALCEGAEQAVTIARERQKAELGPTKPYGAEDRSVFATHILLALDGLRLGIEQLQNREVAKALLLVLSSMLVKLSNKPGDSSNREQPKRLARSFPFRFFLQKTAELGQRLSAYAARVPASAPPAQIEAADARRLSYLRPSSVQLVVSSPPYPGVYDYFEHHALRLRWLRMEGHAFKRGEIGARRDSHSDPEEALRRWRTDFGACLRELRRALRPGGCAALLVADSTLAGRAYRADEWVPQLAAEQRLSMVGRACQERPHFHQPTAQAFLTRARREHLLLLAHA